MRRGDKYGNFNEHSMASTSPAQARVPHLLNPYTAIFSVRLRPQATRHRDRHVNSNQCNGSRQGALSDQNGIPVILRSWILPSSVSRSFSMTIRAIAAVAAASLLASVALASATTMNETNSKSSDMLSLPTSQQRIAWRDLHMNLPDQKGPPGFTVKIGAVVPNSVSTAPVTAKAASDVPTLKPYRFAMLRSNLVIINPSDHRIAEVITR
jgi:hypothetical protein